MVPPKSAILIGFSIIFSIHFGGPPLFLETPIYEMPKIKYTHIHLLTKTFHFKPAEADRGHLGASKKFDPEVTISNLNNAIMKWNTYMDG